MPPRRINPKTLEFIISDKDLQRARIIAILKAAANTQAFKKIEQQEPGKHKILAVQLGNETFKIEEPTLRQTPSTTLETTTPQHRPTTTTSTKKYEGNLNNMAVACACGQTHNLGTPTDFKTTTTQYTDSLQGRGATSTSTYNPAASEGTTKNLYDNKSGGTASYQGNTTGTAGYSSNQSSSAGYSEKKKKNPLDY